MIQITICRPGKTGILSRKCNNNATNFQEITANSNVSS